MTDIQKQEPKPLTLINLALEKGTDIDKLKQLFDLQERWEKKEAEKSFYEAFSNFQLNCPKIKKSKKVNYNLREGGSVNYNYAPLSEICEQIKKPLATNGLSYRWEFNQKGNNIECICTVAHTGGHTKTCSFEAPIDTSGKKSPIQQIASTHTYLQRYTLIGALGLSSAEDDIDGEDVNVKNKGKKGENQQTPQPITPTIIFNEEELIRHKSMIDNLKTSDEFKEKKKEILISGGKNNVDLVALKDYFVKMFNVVDAQEKKSKLKGGQQLGFNEQSQMP